MPQAVKPGDPGRQIESILTRVERLEKKTTKPGGQDLRLPFVLFAFDNELVEDNESPPLDAKRAMRFASLRARVLVAPGGGDCTIELKRNGSLVRTITIPDGDLFVDDSDLLTLAADSYLTATVTAANGAEDLAICGELIV